MLYEIWRKVRQTHTKMCVTWLSNHLWRNRPEFYAFLTFYAGNLLTGTYVPANGIEFIVLPLHDGQILLTSGRKKDAFQKQWLQRANWTCFEISPPFVIGSRFAIMVVVVVIVLNYTSPKFHKPPFGDIDSCMHLNNMKTHIYTYSSLSLRPQCHTITLQLVDPI